MTEKEHSIFIKHILEAIKESEKSLENLSSEFLKDIYKRAAAVRRIEIVGEAVKNLPADFKDNIQRFLGKYCWNKRQINSSVFWC